MFDLESAIDDYVETITDQLRQVRRHLHSHPEPSGEEFQTTLYLVEQLEKAQIPHQVIPSQRGIVVESPTNASGPRVVMRADMDALRIYDEKEVEYRSQCPGIMHACGHDAHSTMVLGATLALQRLQERLSFPWRAIFQPAEETSQGAEEMIAAGAVDNARAIIALHVDPEMPVGHVALRHGELTACCQELAVTIHGHGGHAARPHHATDPLSAAVHFVGDVYQLIPRAMDSREPVVVTFGVIQGGDNPNVIPERVSLQGTLRTLKKQSIQEVREILERIRRGVSEVTDTTIDVRFLPGPDAVVNDVRLTDIMWQVAEQVVGPQNVHYIPQPSMGGEDFAAYLAHVPGCLLRLGVAREGRPKHFLHSPRFDIDERALAIGAKILARTLIAIGRQP